VPHIFVQASLRAWRKGFLMRQKFEHRLVNK
jgi:hypothetical protein